MLFQKIYFSYICFANTIFGSSNRRLYAVVECFGNIIPNLIFPVSVDKELDEHNTQKDKISVGDRDKICEPLFLFEELTQI